MVTRFFQILTFSCLLACGTYEHNDTKRKPNKIFQDISSSHSGISFENRLTETDSLNYFTYGYMYMGGGVSAGDVNNDGLCDLYFTGNMVSNKLYLNRGNLKFQDITTESGTGADDRWITGVTMVDINADGWNDIYVSVAGQSGNKSNLLYINQGVNNQGIPSFTEQAKEYGIADEGQSTQATFFDYDLDGDLDLYVANYPITDFKSPNFYYSNEMRTVKSSNSDHFYRNNGNNTFGDITKEAGLLSFGLSLSVTASDFNQDGLTDLYVSNDFASPDYMYFNNGDGTFVERAGKQTRHTSFYGMGVDIADFNNDGLLDIVQMDMTPEDNRRSKANMASMNPEGFQEMVDLGLHYQYMKNSLQLNQGLDKDGYPLFGDISYMAGVALTDWSWACLFADLNNDGLKDIFVTNGSRRDINNKDYFKKIEPKTGYFNEKSKHNKDYIQLVDDMPSEKVDNYVFKNNGNLSFSQSNQEWGLSYKGFSNGAAYADLDNDGDLEVIINNIDAKVSIFENLAIQNTNNNYIKFKLNGPKYNKLALGTKITITHDTTSQFHELTLTRGFQSSVQPIVHFGLGHSSSIQKVSITWPDGKKQVLESIEVNRLIEFNYNDAMRSINTKAHKDQTLFTELSPKNGHLHQHTENQFDDYDFQVLLPHKMSNFGPALAVGDINSDGLEDFYIGGSAGADGIIYTQNNKGEFVDQSKLLEENRSFEDIDAQFLDVDNDNDLDLYVVSGGNEYESGNANYSDRLYINENGTLRKSEGILPELYSSGSCVRPFDYDQDGDLDLFVGGRIDPRNYPFPGQSYILENKTADGNLRFENVTENIADGLSKVGMVTDALWSDFDSDGQIDLIVVGEWMPIKVFIYSDGEFLDQSDKFFSRNTTGWWFSIDLGDFDNDGDMDYLLGNMGKNYKYQASPEELFAVYAADFDANGKNDIVLSYHNFGEEYPVRGRQCSSEQIPAIKSNFKDYNSFAIASMDEIYGSKNLEQSLQFKIENFGSIFLENSDNGYISRTLPHEAQISSINDWLIQDFNKDGNLDFIAVGGLYSSEVETPRNDAGLGLVALGGGNNQFKPLPPKTSGLMVPHDSKKVKRITIGNKNAFIVANNQGPVQIFIENDNSNFSIARLN
ncbi:MAG: VCBS repeat-containing protein [Cyclobacteriaceae bacterium]